MRFDEKWISAEQLSETANLAQSTNHLAGEVIEIGTWQGLSAIPIAQAVAPALLHVVDHWQGDARDDPPAELVARDNYNIFLSNIAEAGCGNVKIWKMGWREFAADWDQPIRFLHIDASHTADEVSDNIAALKQFAVNGAIFAGDDYTDDYQHARGPVAEGVHRQFHDVHVSENGILWWAILNEGRTHV